ncbi:MAG: hypothetical protein JXQ87_07525 [Bacteroidia bacterium]
MKVKPIRILTICALFLFAFASCTWEEGEPFDGSDVSDVSYEFDILPIWNESCNMSGCHPSGGIPPDLSIENGFESIIALDMVDTLAPEESILYKRMIDAQKPMPTTGILPPSQTNLVLVWITEGAKNN